MEERRSTSTRAASGNIDNRADVLSYKRVSRSLVGGSNNANNRTYFTGSVRGSDAGVRTRRGGHVLREAGKCGTQPVLRPGIPRGELRVFKDFAITERVKFQLRAQAYNLFNTPQFTNPDGDINDGLQRRTERTRRGRGRALARSALSVSSRNGSWSLPPASTSRDGNSTQRRHCGLQCRPFFGQR